MSQEAIIHSTHYVVVTIFLLIYLIKTFLLISGKKDQLTKFTKIIKVPEMIISFTFLATGIYLLTKMPEINKFMIIKLVAVFISIPVAIIGFKKTNKVLATLSLVLILVAYALAEIGHKHLADSNNQSTNSEVINSNDGQALYVNYCVKCHGEDGKAGAMGATDLSLSQLGDEAIKDILKNGKSGVMPAFSTKLNDPQTEAVIAYVKTLRK